MTFFTTVFYVLAVALIVGFAVSVVIFVPLTIYTVPYCLWVGFQNNKGKFKNLKKEHCFKAVKHSTELYKSWIFHKAPVFR